MEKLQEYIERNQINAELVDLGVPMTTAEKAAVQLGTEVRNIFKSIVVTDTKENYAILVLPGDGKIHFRSAAKVLGWKRVVMANSEQALRETGFAAGGTPPIGHTTAHPVIVDESLRDYEFGYAGGGETELLLRISPSEIIRTTNGKFASVQK